MRRREQRWPQARIKVGKRSRPDPFRMNQRAERAPSASPGRGVAEGGDLGTAESCRLMDRFYAQYLTMYVVFVNRVGLEDGIAFWGGSEVVAPDGTVVARAPDFEEKLLMADIDPDLVARERDRNPLIRDERPDLVIAQLMRERGMVRSD